MGAKHWGHRILSAFFLEHDVLSAWVSAIPARFPSSVVSISADS